MHTQIIEITVFIMAQEPAEKKQEILSKKLLCNQTSLYYLNYNCNLKRITGLTGTTTLLCVSLPFSLLTSFLMCWFRNPNLLNPIKNFQVLLCGVERNRRIERAIDFEC